jgi:hypothetical protein
MKCFQIKKEYITMNIKKKLIALTSVLAIAASFAGCSDKESDTTAANKDNNVVASEHETLSSEEYNQIAKHDLEIKPYVPGGSDTDDNVQQDAVEGGNNNADNNTVQQDAVEGGNNNADNNANNNVAGGNTSADNNNVAGNNSSTPVEDNDPGNNNAELPAELQVYNGTRTLMQAWWMDISKSEDYIFNGEYLTAEFKIKEGTADGIYPITLDWLDFANWNGETVKFTAIDGAVIVGGEATENKFNDDGTPQVMVSNVSGKAGDTVKVAIYVENNPGVVANILRFGYNSDVLEYVGGGEGADFNGTFN